MTEKRSPLDQALDLLFYAPLGLVLNADEVIPQLIERGRQQVTMARMFGQFAVKQGQTEAGKALAKAQGTAVSALEQLGARAGSPPRSRSDGQAARPQAAARPSATPATGATSKASGPANGPDAGGLAIPDYDSLSASQVVPRLAGLSHDELEAVRDYENAKRARKTILNKVAQLQG